MSIRVPGLSRFLYDLQRFAARVAETRDPDREARERVATAIAIAAPKRSGRLAASTSPDATGVEISAPYAGVIAYGWPARGITANPFVETGLSRATEQATDAYQDHVGDSLRVIARSY